MVFVPSKGWNHTIIDQTVLPFEGELIKQIPLIPEIKEDQLMWPHTKEGVYAVKSGYNLICQWEQSANPSSAQTTSQMRSQLCNRDVQCQILCSRCLEKIETMNHVFMECQYAAKIWFGSKLGVRFTASHRDFAEWLIYSITHLNNNDLSYVAAIIYGIWYARNQLIFEINDIEDNTIITLASKWINEYQNVNTKDTKVPIDTSTYGIRQQASDRNRKQHSANQSNRWKKPIKGIIKINCDANLAVEGRWGLGVLCRNFEGELLAAATWEIPGIAEPILAEACALYYAVKLVLDCGFFNVLIESDCNKAIDLVKEECEIPKPYLGDFIRGVFCNKTKFSYCNFGHIRR
ncbi:hypothetical protein TSUD_334130 [Trifolium subterraneum]|uniref:Uncharacterized protein n=1 Tax=Trifolium subterraneum TaxID=3900 RepID=A0A2Z6LWF9_TRISU|nr:hypothetical protein TSUD_334130 [Trifolium subterraneum]